MTGRPTRGPWRWQAEGDRAKSLTVRGRNHEVVARIFSRTAASRANGYPPDYEDRKADARLIAAAPSMLAALKAAWQFIAARTPHPHETEPGRTVADAIERAGERT